MQKELYFNSNRLRFASLGILNIVNIYLIFFQNNSASSTKVKINLLETGLTLGKHLSKVFNCCFQSLNLALLKYTVKSILNIQYRRNLLFMQTIKQQNRLKIFTNIWKCLIAKIHSTLLIRRIIFQREVFFLRFMVISISGFYAMQRIFTLFMHIFVGKLTTNFNIYENKIDSILSHFVSDN